MKRIVRTMAGFYEAQGEFAVPAPQAGDIIQASAQVVGQYTGPIAVSAVRGLRIPLSADRKLSLGMLRPAPGSELDHTMVITQRCLEHPDYKGSDDVLYDGLNGGTVYGSRVVASEVLVSVHGAGKVPDSLARVSAVHELGHSFNLGHCAVPTCIMLPYNQLDEASGRPALYDSLVSGRPFCDPCAGQLEVAGYQALGAQL